MILSGKEIEARVAGGAITISPFNRSNLNPNSYNYHLGADLLLIKPFGAPDERLFDQHHPIPSKGFVLEPEHSYLGVTEEVIGSDSYVTSLVGRSSMGRLGLFLQISANLGHQGAIHRWTLELKACLPIRVYAGQTIGQVTFWEVTGAPNPYAGYYGRFHQPHPSKDA